MRVHISYVQGAYLRDYERDYVPTFSAELRRQSDGRYSIEDDPARADLIILWEGFEYKRPEYISVLENDPLIREHATRVYTINYDDHPEGFLAGIYTSLEAPFFDPVIHRIRPFFLMNNQEVYRLTRDQVMARTPQWLFSFAGAISHPVRKRLLDTFAQPSPEYHIEHVNKWYNHGDVDRNRFVDVMLNTLFGLCPHGYCAYTPRITEVMAMARVPVIIADDWIPFSFDEDVPYFLKVPEKDIPSLPDILLRQKPEADTIRQNARNLWEKYCGPERNVVSLVDCLADLAARSCDLIRFEDYRARWHSRTLLTNLGWTARQRLALRIEQHLQRWFPMARVPGVTSLMRYRNAPNLK